MQLTVALKIRTCLQQVSNRVRAQCDIRAADPLVQPVEGVRPVGSIVSIKGIPAGQMNTFGYDTSCVLKLHCASTP